jgi:hypothetical protein
MRDRGRVEAEGVGGVRVGRDRGERVLSDSILSYHLPQGWGGVGGGEGGRGVTRRRRGGDKYRKVLYLVTLHSRYT